MTPNQCMGCQAGWPLIDGRHPVPPNDNRNPDVEPWPEHVACTRDRYDDLDYHPWPPRPVGGQHVTRTLTGVLVIHRPTGIAVVCESERSQLANRTEAERMLREVLERCQGLSQRGSKVGG